MLLRTVFLLASVIGPEEKKRAVRLQVLLITASVVETVSLLMIIPIASFISGGESVALDFVRRFISNWSDFDKTEIVATLIVLYAAIVIVSAFLGIWSIRALSILAAEVGADLSVKLYRSYLSLPYSDFVTKNTSQYSSQITVEVARITDNVLQPLAQINSRVGSGVLILVAMMFYLPLPTLLVTLFFSIAYYGMYVVLRPKLKRFGALLSEANAARENDVEDALDAVKEIKVYGAVNQFSTRFALRLRKLSAAYSALNVLYNTPRYFIDSLIYLVFACLAAVTVVLSTGLEYMLQYLLFFGMAAIKLLPIVQQIYGCVARIRGSYGVVNAVSKQIRDGHRDDDNIVMSDEWRTQTETKVDDLGLFVLDNVNFKYPGERNNALTNITLTLPRSGRVALIGRSGSGKTTLVNLISGLLEPTSGNMYRFGKKTFESSRMKPGPTVSYVPQFPVIITGTLSANVAFGVEEDDIDLGKVKDCLSRIGLSHLDDLIENKPDDAEALINLSGGERQRLSLARALYRDSEVIVLDEPTSALDPNSEAIVTEELKVQGENKLIVTVAHRLHTVEEYDVIYLLNGGHMAAFGSFAEISLTPEFEAYLSLG